MDFPVDGGLGKAEVNLYERNSTGPTVMNCSFWECSKTYGDGGQRLDCQKSQCCSQGEAIDGLLKFINLVSGPSTVTLNTDGSGSMHQACMPSKI